jgi:predicted ATPase
VDTRKAIALLAYLVVSGETHTRDTLAALLWPDSDQSRARAALRRTLSVLRKALNKDVLKVTRESIGVDPEARIWCDVNEFRRLLAECETHGHPPSQVCAACIAPLEGAVDLYRDDFMAGFTLRDSYEFDDWQFFQGDSLRRDLSSALERLVESSVQRGDFSIGIEYAQRWLAIDSLHEPAHRSLMRLFAAAGRRNAALRQYQECSRFLEKELGVSPLEETTELYKEIKDGHWEEVKDRSTLTKERPVILDSPPPLPSYPLSPTQYPLIGRAAEWAVLQSSYAAIRESGRFVVLEGEAGIGKTRLAEDFLTHSRQNGAITISTRCYEGESDLAYAPFLEGLRLGMERAGSTPWWQELSPHWLSETARLVPELADLKADLPPPAPMESPGAMTRFYEGVCRVFQALCGQGPPGILSLDDLQWADEASLDLLTYLVRRLEGRPMLVLGAWRAVDLSPDHQLHSLVMAAQRRGVGVRLQLSRLSEPDIADLIQAVINSGSEIPEGIGEKLFKETEGLPFFVVEYLSALSKEAALQDGDWRMPHGVRGLLRSRLSPVSEVGAQILQTAAVIGRSFDFDILKSTSGRGEEETIEALEELIEDGLIREVDVFEEPSFQSLRSLVYDFSHHKVRELIYQELSQARSRLLHRRVAQALVKRLQANGSQELAGLIAHHFKQAGEGQKAALYFQQAGEHASTLFANAEALKHYQSALALDHPDATQIFMAIGDLHTLRGEYIEAISSYDKAIPLCSPMRRAEFERKLGSVHHRLGEWEEAEAHFKLALKALDEEQQTVEQARLLADWSLMAHQLGDEDGARARAQQALKLAKASEDPQALAQVHNLMGILARSRGDFEDALFHLSNSLELAEGFESPGPQVAALNNLALAWGDSGDTERALELAEAALRLCASQGDRHREAALHNNMADLLHNAGRTEAAMSHLKRAVAIFTEIGADAETWQPEIWKLVEW